MKTLSIIMMAIIVTAVLSCNDQKSIDLAGPGNLEQDQAYLSSANPELALIEEKLNGIPDLGEWKVFRSLDELISYNEQYGLVEIFGHKIIDDALEVVARAQEKASLKYISPEEHDYFLGLFIELLNNDKTLSQAKKDEYLGMYEDAYLEHTAKQARQKTKEISTVSLASTPALGATDIEEGNHEELISGDPYFAEAWAYSKFQQPGSYVSRIPATVAGGFVVEQSQVVGFAGGCVNIFTIFNYICGTLHSAQYCDSSIAGAKVFSVEAPFAVLNSISTDRPSIWSMGSISTTLFNYHWDEEEEAFDYSTIENSGRFADPPTPYDMGGRGDVVFSGNYSMNDVDSCMYYVANPNEMDAYRAFACDVTKDGNYTVSDVLQILLYVRDGVCP